MRGLAPSTATRWVIGIVVGLVFAVPFAATALFTLAPQPGTEGYTFSRWLGIFDPANAARYAPIWTGLGNSLILAAVTVALVLFLFTPTMVWRPESIRAWARAAASSMRSFGMPASIALAMPPS